MRAIPDKKIYTNNDKKMVIEVRIANLTGHDISITELPSGGMYWGPAYKLIDDKKIQLLSGRGGDIDFFSTPFIEIKKGLTYKEFEVYEKDEEPFIHAHINISDHDLTVKGGHLFEAKVAVVGEFILWNINSSGTRVFNPGIGLACMSLGK